MDVLKLRAMGNRLINDEGGSTVTTEVGSVDYLALVIDDPSRLGKWFQKDFSEPKSKTNVYFQLGIDGEDEVYAQELEEAFAVGSYFNYNGTAYAVERVLPVRAKNLTMFFYLIADPL